MVHFFLASSSGIPYCSTRMPAYLLPYSHSIHLPLYSSPRSSLWTCTDAFAVVLVYGTFSPKNFVCTGFLSPGPP
ncbi:hypothetical protein M404DRAFT_215260 [Pisolithus tinctorius Marx 270]|uniref:Uncharacterized protein n=1 Tax=Pisolithus tinctorius Marx 270 TaxID=870435 RepID=A0A0C3P8R7_PISTI|nr:hypothetical protein M404DRAFT_215260 [Pisolithus tinctorius Marx 270]